MAPDSHAIDGQYEIRSLYFDNRDDKALREKLDGVSRREKYRIRMYNNDPSVIRLERKFKCSGLGYKESALLTQAQACQIAGGDIPVSYTHLVLTVLKSCETARDDLKLINAELARLEFKSQYAFEVRYVKDGSRYEKILEYARYLKEREELGTASGQMTFDVMTFYSNDKGEELERDMKKIINQIVESNDKEQIEHYADLSLIHI